MCPDQHGPMSGMYACSLASGAQTAAQLEAQEPAAAPANGSLLASGQLSFMKRQRCRTLWPLRDTNC